MEKAHIINEIKRLYDGLVVLKTEKRVNTILDPSDWQNNIMVHDQKVAKITNKINDLFNQI
jgi:conjugal transfer/entry exclusion protein